MAQETAMELKGRLEGASASLTVGELARRNMLISSTINTLEEMEAHSRASSLQTQPHHTSSQPHFQRAELLSGTSPPSSSSFSTRKFGRSNGGPESEKTRMMDNQDLLMLQKTEMETQDKVVESLAKVVQRQKEISLVISKELDEQNALLEQVQDQVEKVETGLNIAQKKTRRILEN